MGRVRLPAGDHLTRAREHEQVGDALKDAVGNEWAAVCYFYSAYHLVRAALVADPIFDSMARLKAKSSHLMPSDRYTDSHHGSRAPGMNFGVNELVNLLYPQILQSYEFLHQASIAVRYDTGLRFDLTNVRGRLDAVIAASDSGLAAT